MEITDGNSEKIVNLNEYASEITFEMVYDRYFDRVYKFFLYRLGDKSISEDLTSDTFIKILNNLGSYDREISGMGTWVFTIAKNTLYDYFRKNSRRKLLSLDNFIDFFSSEKYVEDELELDEEKRYLRKSLEKLSDRERTIVALKYGAELSNSEIATLMDISVSNTGVILHRTLKKLKGEMEEYYES